MSGAKTESYGLSTEMPTGRVTAPDVRWRFRQPKNRARGIGLVGCGGISEQHLSAYRRGGFRVVALCDRNPEKMEQRRRDYYPEARLYGSPRELLADPEVEVVDLTPHPSDRYQLMVQAVEAGKHVLSQKPFVTDLTVGEELVQLAREAGVKLAVNQNGRFAPHFAFARAALSAGHLGELSSVSFQLGFDHNWTADTPFNEIHHLILYDFAIHWFDMAQALAGHPASSVMARVKRSPSQRAAPPLLAHAIIDYPHAQVSMAINGDTRFGQRDRTVITGTAGTLVSDGPNLNEQLVTLHSQAGWSRPELTGAWFNDGFLGAMSELLYAVDTGSEPSNGAEENLQSLALCFAAIASADSNEPVQPGTVRRLPVSAAPHS